MGFITNSKPGGPTWNHPGRVLTTGDPSGGLDHWQQQHHVAEIALLRRKAGDLARPPKRPGVPWEKHRILMAFVVEKPWKFHKNGKAGKTHGSPIFFTEAHLIYVFIMGISWVFLWNTEDFWGLPIWSDSRQCVVLNGKLSGFLSRNIHSWLVVLTVLKNISQWEGLSHIL